MATRAELKERAKDQLGHKLFGDRWLNMLLAFLILGLLLGAVSGSVPYNLDGLDGIRVSFNVIISIAALIVTGPLTYGAARVAITAAIGIKTAQVTAETFLIQIVLNTQQTAVHKTPRKRRIKRFKIFQENARFFSNGSA